LLRQADMILQEAEGSVSDKNDLEDIRTGYRRLLAVFNEEMDDLSP
jgi:hypothetical protein